MRHNHPVFAPWQIISTCPFCLSARDLTPSTAIVIAATATVVRHSGIAFAIHRGKEGRVIVLKRRTGRMSGEQDGQQKGCHIIRIPLTWGWRIGSSLPLRWDCLLSLSCLGCDFKSVCFGLAHFVLCLTKRSQIGVNGDAPKSRCHHHHL